MKTNKRLYNLLKEFNETRTAQGRPCDLTLLNICYFLGNFNHTELNNEWDACIIYDNLDINNEILDIDTIGDYEPTDIERITGHRYATIKRNIEAGYIYLLNYYSIKNGRTTLKNCFIKLDSNWNIF